MVSANRRSHTQPGAHCSGGTPAAGRLSPLIVEYPEIKLEFDINYSLRDIVADRFDAGVRLGDYVDRRQISPAFRLVIDALRLSSA